MYEIQLLTKIGIVTELYNTNENLESFEKRMIEKYKTFTT